MHTDTEQSDAYTKPEQSDTIRCIQILNKRMHTEAVQSDTEWNYGFALMMLSRQTRQYCCKFIISVKFNIKNSPIL